MKFLHFGSSNNDENNTKANGIIKMLKNLKKAKKLIIKNKGVMKWQIEFLFLGI